MTNDNSKIAFEKNGVYDITAFGAVGDGETMNTQAIQTAIDECAANGGGMVRIPPGTYVSGTLLLKSHVHLHLEAGAILLGSEDLADYPPTRTKNHRALYTNYDNLQLLYAEGQSHIAITGLGTIDLRGWNFKNRVQDNSSNCMRPFVFIIRFIQCEQVHVANVTLRNSGAWVQQYLACKFVHVRGLKVFSHSNVNNDLIDIDGCSNVVVSDIMGSSEDDAITLKSSGPEICENISITNCVVHSNVNAIKLGTEGSGGYRNITVSNIVVHKKNIETPHHHGMADGCGGISLMMVDGGVMENVRISNIVMEGPRTPLFIRLANRARGYHPDVKVEQAGRLHDVVIDHVTVLNHHKHMCHITGIEGHPVRGITVSNFRMTAGGGGTLEDAERPVPEDEKGYPDGGCLGMGAAYGFYIRHAEEVRLRNLELATRTPDLRPGIMIEHVQKIEIDGADIQANENGRAAIVLNQVGDAWIRNVQISGKAKAVVEVNGENSADVQLDAFRRQNYDTQVRLGPDVSQGAVNYNR